jgi:hypothetical protein
MIGYCLPVNHRTFSQVLRCRDSASRSVTAGGVRSVYRDRIPSHRLLHKQDQREGCQGQDRKHPERIEIGLSRAWLWTISERRPRPCCAATA